MPQILHIQFFSTNTVKYLFFLLFFAQILSIVIPAHIFSESDVIVCFQESEELNSKEEKTEFDEFESAFSLAFPISISLFFSDYSAQTFFKEHLFIVLNFALESPPPEMV